MPKRSYYGKDRRRGYVFGRFYRDDDSGEYHQPLKVKLINIDELEFRETRRGKVRRSEAEKHNLLQSLYNEVEKQLEQSLKKKHFDSPLVSEVFGKWLSAVKDFRSIRTYGHYKKAVEHFFKANPKTEKTLKAEDLGIEHFQKTARYMANKFCQNTANSYLRELRAGLQWAKDNNLISQPPKITLFRVQQDVPQQVFTELELDAMLYELSKRRTSKRRWELLLRTWYFLRWTGIRGSELLFLTWKDVNWEQELIFLFDRDQNKVKSKHFQALQASKGEKLSRKDQHSVKGGVFQTVPIPGPLMQFLKTLEIRNEKFVLDDGFGDMYWKHLNELTSAMRKFQSSLGIKSYTEGGPKPLHGFRSTLATVLANEPMQNITDVQELLRHTSINTTMGYIQKKKDNIKRMIEKTEKR